MFGKMTGSKEKNGLANAQKFSAAMLDVIALAASLVFILAACATALPEVGNTTGASPVVSESPPASSGTTADVTASAMPSSEVPYAEYALVNRSGGVPLHPGVQEGAFPWGLTLDVDVIDSHTSGDMAGVVFHRVNGDNYRLFYHHIEETGKDVISAFMTTQETYETARGLGLRDPVEKLLETYADNLLYVPDPFPISRDLGGDFCVYNELFVYTRPEDNNCCIVFYIASNPDGKFITGIRISLGQDGGPEYFADDVNTVAVDYKNLDRYLKTDTTDEERVHELLDRLLHTQGPGEAGGSISASDVLAAMTDMNWRIYSQLYADEAFDAMDWLYRQKLTGAQDILCVLKATKGLDGAYSETYSGILANIYRNDSRECIRLTAQLDPAQIDTIARLICYDLSLDMDTVLPRLEGYQKSGGLTDMEQLVVSDFQRYFELWYSDQ